MKFMEQSIRNGHRRGLQAVHLDCRLVMSGQLNHPLLQVELAESAISRVVIFTGGPEPPRPLRRMVSLTAFMSRWGVQLAGSVFLPLMCTLLQQDMKGVISKEATSRQPTARFFKHLADGSQTVRVLHRLRW